MPESSLPKQFSSIALGRVVSAALQAITLILLARDAGPVAFGLFAVLFGLATVFQTGFDLGIVTLLIKERARRDPDRLIPTALRLNDLTSTMLCVAFAALIVAMALWIEASYWQLLPLAVWVGASRNSSARLGIALADGNVRVNTSASVANRAMSLSIYVLAVALGVEPLLSFALSSAAAAIIASVFMRRYTAHLMKAPTTDRRYRDVLKSSWPYWLNSLGTQAKNFDVAIVSMVAGPLQAGYYGTAVRVTGPLRILPSSLASIFLPAASSRSAGEVRKLVKPMMLFMLSLALLFGVLTALMPLLIDIFLGSEYSGATPSLQVIVGGLLFSSIGSVLSTLLQGRGAQIFVGKLAVWMTVLSLVLATLGAVQHGALGAAVGSSLAVTIQACLLALKAKSWLSRESS